MKQQLIMIFFMKIILKMVLNGLLDLSPLLNYDVLEPMKVNEDTEEAKKIL